MWFGVLNKNLFGESVVDRSLAIIREFEPPDGYWLAFSGGKDSVVLLRLAEMAGVKFEAHYNVTTIDPPELTRFIKREYPQVIWDMPLRSFFELCKTDYPPTRKMRWCCRALKEGGGQGRRVLLGVRAAESVRRSRYKVVSLCLKGGRKERVAPMLHWSDDDVWSFIHSEGIPYCHLYDDGFKRLGCVICPMQTQAEKARSMEKWPRYWARMRAMCDLAWERYENIQRFGATKDEYWEWWISGVGMVDDRQEELEFGE